MVKGKIGYTFDDGSILWAETRALELLKGGDAVESLLKELAEGPAAMRNAAKEMDNQPESDRIMAMAKALEGFTKELSEMKEEWMRDREMILRGIKNYGRMKRDGYVA